MRLTNRHRVFVELVLQGIDHTTAYRKAGFSGTKETARRNASRLLTNADIRDHLRTRQEQLSTQLQEETHITKRDVILELAKLAFSRISDFVEWDDKGLTLRCLEGTAKATTGSIKAVRITKDYISVTMHDKLGALVTLGKHLGLFEPHLEIPELPHNSCFRINVIGNDDVFEYRREGGELTVWRLVKKGEFYPDPPSPHSG